MRIFSEIDFEQVIRKRFQQVQTEVQSLEKSILLQSDDESLVNSIISRTKIEPLRFIFDNISISTFDKDIPASQHPKELFFLQLGNSYKRQIVRYHIPFTGESILLRCIPNPRLLWSIDVDVNNSEITFDIVNWNNQAEDVKRKADYIFNNLKQQLDNLSKQVDKFNSSLQSQVSGLFSEEKEKLNKQTGFISGLGFPLKKPEVTKLSSEVQNSIIKNKATSNTPNWDVFISHASEDKEEFVRELANTLTTRGLKVWYDEFTLRLGDSLRRSIDNGLSNSRFGIVVLSQNFFSKEWPQKELDGLVAKEESSEKFILPVWHKVTKKDVSNFSPILADRVAVSSGKGMEHVVNEILNVVNNKKPN